jgi:3-hydroxyacyl-[acyl-carrier-protein] dehydratase
MSLQSLYSITDIKKDATTFEAKISFDPGHEIFEGHFPGQAVVPGVCLIRIVKDVAANVVQKELELKIGNNIKFLKIIDPRLNTEVLLKGSYSYVTDTRLSISASLSESEAVFVKYKGIFQVS